MPRASILLALDNNNKKFYHKGINKPLRFLSIMKSYIGEEEVDSKLHYAFPDNLKNKKS